MNKIFTFILLSLASITALAQTRTLNGKVISAQDKQPLIAASVAAMEKNASGNYQPTVYGAFTDIDGSFTIDVPQNAAALEFSYMGFETKIVEITASSSYEILLKPDAMMIETVVVTVPYGKQKKQSFTGSLTSIQASDIVKAQTASFEKALQGQVPGVVLNVSSGEPGAPSEIKLRGVGSISAGSSPLIVIDGVPMFSGEVSQLSAASSILTTINPNDIESISILKDASATSLYGSRASNGVIMVTTKSGKQGKTAYSFSTSQGLGIVNTNNFRLMNADEYRGWLTEAMRNAGKSEAQIAEATIRDTANTNWFDEILRPAWNQSYEFSAQGGKDGTSFFASGQYKNEQGIARGTDLERFSARLNLSHKASDKCTFGIKMNPSFTTQNMSRPIEYFSNPITGAYTTRPTLAVKKGDSYNFDNRIFNPSGLIALNEQNSKTMRMLGNAFVELALPHNFEFKTIANIDYINNDEIQFNHPETPDGKTRNGMTENVITNVSTWTSSSTLRWDFKHLKHSLQILGGFEAESSTTDHSYIAVSNFANPEFHDISNAAVLLESKGYSTASTLLSGISNIQYNFAAKYYLSASFRVDGSSKFSPSHRWAPFWSVGASWIASDERFMQSVSWIDLLKVRGSYGTSGNSDIDNYLYMQLYSFGNNYLDIPGSAPLTMGNPELTWEKNHNIDVGIDLKIFKRFTFGLDLYNRNTFDLLLQVPVSMVSGYETQMQNVGSMVNRGVEFSAAATVVKTDKFSWNTNLTFALNRNEITKLYDEDTIVSGTKIRTIGQALQTFYLAEWAGVNSADGSPLWRDSNGNLTRNYNQANKVIAGNADPKFTAGWTNTFTYGNWSLNLMIYCNYGNLVFNQLNSELISDCSQPDFNQSVAALDYWKKPGDQSPNPKPILNNGTNSALFSTRYLEDGSYIRIKNIQLNYSVPAKACEKLKLNNCMIYLQAQNPFVFSKFSGFDPETRHSGVYYFDYPKQRSFMLGVNIGF